MKWTQGVAQSHVTSTTNICIYVFLRIWHPKNAKQVVPATNAALRDRRKGVPTRCGIHGAYNRSNMISKIWPAAWPAAQPPGCPAAQPLAAQAAARLPVGDPIFEKIWCLQRNKGNRRRFYNLRCKHQYEWCLWPVARSRNKTYESIKNNITKCKKNLRRTHLHKTKK